MFGGGDIFPTFASRFGGKGNDFRALKIKK